MTFLIKSFAGSIKDVIGWIDIYNTNIDYPIVKGADNQEYLNKTVKGEFSTAGSIFLDSSNSPDFSDYPKYTLWSLYGRRKRCWRCGFI